MPDQNYNTGNGLTPVEEPRGVWVAYYSDRSELAIYATEIDALRRAVDSSMAVAFWEFATDLTDLMAQRRSA